MKSESTYHFLKARITFKISHKMCSMNSLALAKKVCRNSRKPIKNPAEFSYRLAWHKRTNCLSLKPHRKNFARVTCWILFDKLPSKGQCHKIQQKLHAEFCLTNYHWRVNVTKFNKIKRFEIEICLVTGHEAHWSCFTVLNVLEKAKPEHFQTMLKRSHSVQCAPEINWLFPWK